MALSSSNAHIEDEFNHASRISIEDTKENSTKEYSSLSVAQKYGILAIVATAAFLSTLSANIYFPALGVIQKDLHTTPELINLTVSLYMVFQGLSPSFWAPLADQWGRRPVYLATTTVYLIANIALSLAPNYPAVLVFRMLQAFGSGPVIALGAGCISDIANPTERGIFFGIYTAGPQVSFAFGPVIGGIIAQNLGWRWIFWVLVIFAGVLLIAITFLLRETLRSLVGDGSGYANPTPSQWLKKHVKRDCPGSTTDYSRFLHCPNMLKPLIYAFQPDIGLCLIYNAIAYSIFYAMLASYSGLLETIYELDQLDTGLCYMPTGIGCILGSIVGGKILDRDFRIISKRHNYDVKILTRSSLDIDYPVYAARLRTVWINHTIFSGKKANLTSEIIPSHFDLIWFHAADQSAFSLDLGIPIHLAAVTASIAPGITYLGVQYMFLMLGMILLLSNVVLWVVKRKGPAWRKRRAENTDS
ncbi:hypothetical protein INT43_004246 [Umbelopsis isabellina]|uniref:Major facilitator superfamily (MFS) profile domain-containing protein n=1 Tax=Mortierella isabellina TaxID=91625 RepID=A0A8H7PI56_MORIS|nr:hypothetical protein INT43_004246 [Umbelopsis isabellina]